MPPKLPPGIKIRTDYVPKAKSGGANNKHGSSSKQQQGNKALPTKPNLKQKCPRCLQAIPMDELEQHVRLTDSAQRGKGEILLTYHLSLLYKMRIELLDPKWREQKQRALDKNKEKNLLDNDQVSVNLKNLAEYRPDIFGGDATEAAKKLKKDKERAKEKELAGWDGRMGTMDLAAAMVAKTVTMEDQMAYIHRSRAALEAIGPQVPSTHYRASSSMLPPHPRPTGSHPAPLPPMNAGARAGAIAVGVNGQQVQQPASHPHPHPVHPPPANIHHQAYQDNQYYREPQVHLEHQFQSHQPIVNGTSTTTNSSVYSAVDFLPPTVTNKPTTSQDQLAYIRSRSGSHGGKDDVDQAPMAKRARVD